ncbi:MAG: AraC family transcriptional regulator [Candidatus Azobacteroides sp.]|nr:AraC family transcriptional regulator [Candidatus Azobacteroides sp.]
MIPLEQSLHIKYLPENDQDVLWGLTVHTVGYQHIESNMVYPPCNHPTRYLFSVEKGRILDEYQLLYITRGKGTFISEACKSCQVKAGNMFLLFPGEWHNYSPHKRTGWDEYWIGFKGINMDNRFKNNFFNKQKPIFNIGINEEIVHLYQQGIKIAKEQKTGFQQMLAGIVNYLLGFTYSLDRHLFFEELNVINNINKAKVIMLENFQHEISPEEVAQQVNMSYSWFRRIFKQYTGFAPVQYIVELKIQKSKELLTNSMMSIKEISYQVGFDNSDYFCTTFKKKTGMTPLKYRDFTQGKNL